MGVLKWLDPDTGQYVPLSMSAGGGGGDFIPVTVAAGAGLTGGGTTAANMTLNVGAGTGITVAADSVAVNKTTLDGWYPVKGEGYTAITDWNDAVLNGVTYASNTAAHAPDTGWFFGHCISGSSSSKHQLLMPFANGRWNSGMVWERECEGGVWGDWNRMTSYTYSRDALDGGVFWQHNASGANQGVRRSFWGGYKDKASNNASNSDAFRVTYYTTGGVYTGVALTIPLGTGVVSMPQTYLSAEQLEGEAPVVKDMAATVETVVKVVVKALTRAGLSIDPQDILDLVEAEHATGEPR